MVAAHLRLVDMAKESPQLENGYTRIANDLLDAMVAAGLTARQWAVSMAIVRKTYGFNKKQDDIGLGQLAAMTGIDKAHLSRTVRELADLKILTRTVGTHGHNLGINKNFGQWGLPKEQPVAESATRCQKSNPPVAESATPPVAKRATTKDNPSKDNYQKTKDIPSPQAAADLTARVAKPKGKAAMTAGQRERFNRFYAAYPRKTDRKDAETAFAKLNPDDGLLAEMLAALDREKAAGKHAERKYIKHPATWLNKGCWTDEIQVEYTAEQRAVIEAYNGALGEQLGIIDADVFSEARAGRLDDFMGLSDRPDFWVRYFPYIAENCDLPPGVGLDYLISREGFTKVKGGQHERKA